MQTFDGASRQYPNGSAAGAGAVLWEVTNAYGDWDEVSTANSNRA